MKINSDLLVDVKIPGSIYAQEFSSVNLIKHFSIKNNWHVSTVRTDDSLIMTCIDASGVCFCRLDEITLPVGTYTLSWSANSTFHTVRALDSTGGTLSSDRGDVSPWTFTVSGSPVTFCLGFYMRAVLNTTCTITNIQLEKGNIKTPYSRGKVLTNEDFYSYDEIKIGTFIEGKPIYRKVFLNNKLTSFTTNISNIGYIIDIRVFLHTDNGQWRSLPWLFTQNDSIGSAAWSGGFYYREDNTNINMQCGSEFANRTDKQIVIMEYTKSTD